MFMSDFLIQGINAQQYNPFITGQNKGTAGFSQGNPSVNQPAGQSLTEIQKFKEDMKTFSSGERAVNSRPNTPVSDNPFVQNQALYNAVSSVGTGELSPKSDSKFDMYM